MITTLLKDKDRLLISVLLICIIILGGTTYHRNQFWLSEEVLYKNDLSYEPRSFVMLNNLGRVYYHQERFDLAKSYFLKAVYQSPNYSYDVALNNLGVCYLNEQNWTKAEYYFRQSIFYGQYDLAYKNLLALLRAQGRSVEYDRVFKQSNGYKNK